MATQQTARDAEQGPTWEEEKGESLIQRMMAGDQEPYCPRPGGSDHFRAFSLAGVLHSFLLNFQSADDQGKLVNKYMRTLVGCCVCWWLVDQMVRCSSTVAAVGRCYGSASAIALGVWGVCVNV